MANRELHGPTHSFPTRRSADRVRRRGWRRNGKARADRGPASPRLAGDVLLVEAAADELMSLHDDPGLDLNAISRYGSKLGGDGDSQLVQAVVAPGSEFIGRSIRELDFSRQFNAVIVGLWRRGGDMAQRLSDARQIGRAACRERVCQYV